MAQRTIRLVSANLPAEWPYFAATAFGGCFAHASRPPQPNPPHAVRMTKRLIRGGRDISLAALLELSAAMQSLAHATRDHKEAVTAFLDKRRPTFTGT